MKYSTLLVLISLMSLTSCSIKGDISTDVTLPPVPTENNVPQQGETQSGTDSDSGRISISTIPSLSAGTGAQPLDKEALQKQQEARGLALQKITDPDFIKLQQELGELYSGREIWTDEIVALNAAFTAAITETIKAGSGKSSVDFGEIAKKRGEAMKSFMSSEAYTNYIMSKQPRIDQINSLMKDYEK